MKISQLSIGYRTKKKTHYIVKGLDMEFSERSFNAIVGINGIGKSTLLKTLSGELPPLEGKVYIDNEELHQYTPKDLAKKISIVFTHREENKFLSVLEMVQMGRYPYMNWLGQLSQTDIQKMEEAIQIFELNDLKDRKCSDLSDGQYQKVLLARAFTQDTPYLLLDEPSTHLDLPHKIQLFKTLRELATNYGKTVIICTHEIEYAMEFCDRALVLLKDSYAYNSPKELVNNRVLDKIFPEELVTFNPQTLRFNPKPF